jgi:hypothetical protein
MKYFLPFILLGFSFPAVDCKDMSPDGDDDSVRQCAAESNKTAAADLARAKTLRTGGK